MVGWEDNRCKLVRPTGSKVHNVTNKISLRLFQICVADTKSIRQFSIGWIWKWILNSQCNLPHICIIWPYIPPAHGLGFWTDRSAVHEAAAQGRVLQLQELIEGGAPVNIVAVDSITPLHEACIRGQAQCVRLLLDAGAQVRDCKFYRNYSPQSKNNKYLLFFLLNHVFVTSRWKLATLMAAHHCVTPVQLVAWSVWSCCWSMEQQSTLHYLPSHLFMRLVCQVCRCAYSTSEDRL